MKLASQIQTWRQKLPKSLWVDLGALTFALLIANILFSPKDIGWLGTHPSPYFLLPILLGCRFGFAAGICGGTVGAAIAVGGMIYSGKLGVSEIFSVHGYFIGSLVFIGGVCGELQHAFIKKQMQLTAQTDNMRDRLKKLDSDMFLLREAKSELERIVATRDSEASTLDSEIRRLFDSDGSEIFQTILLLLNRQARISDAAIYTCEGETLRRRGILGASDTLPEKLPVEEVEMVALALKHKTPVTIPEFWQHPPRRHRNYLMVIPLLDSRDIPLGVLIVTGMPFITLTKKTVHMVNLICRWAARVMEMRDQTNKCFRLVGGFENQKVFTVDFFQKNLALCHASFLQHGLPSSVVVFTLPGQPRSLQERFERLIMATVRGGDFPVELDLPEPNLAVLLPLSGERGANVFIDRIMFNCRKDEEISNMMKSRLVTFESGTNVDQIWQKLHEHEPLATNHH